MPNAERPESTTPIDGRSEIIPCEGYTTTTIHVGRPCRPFVAGPGQMSRCEESRGGDFYTACEMCLICDVPHVEAPDLMAYVKHPGDGVSGLHCVFTRQPQTPEEIERAIDAMCGSEVCGIRYAGTDPGILRRVAARGAAAEGTTDRPERAS